VVAAIGFAVAFDLSIDSLEALADQRRDGFDVPPSVEGVGDSDAVILG
jgi:hypothetical protein